MTTKRLLLERYFGSDASADYVDWAVWGLCNKLDSQSLRILGGLHPDKEADEVRFYFKRACRELRLQTMNSDESPRLVAPLIHSCFIEEELTARDAICKMAQMCNEQGFLERDPLFAVWHDIAEAIYCDDYGYPYGDIYYPANQRSDLKETFETEWSFFERGLNIGFPESGGQLLWCRRCGKYGNLQERPKKLTRLQRFWGRLFDRSFGWGPELMSSACGCDSSRLNVLHDWARRRKVCDIFEAEAEAAKR